MRAAAAATCRAAPTSPARSGSARRPDGAVVRRRPRELRRSERGRLRVEVVAAGEAVCGAAGEALALRPAGSPGSPALCRPRRWPPAARARRRRPPAAAPAPVAHGGGAAQSRGGLRRGRSSIGRSSAARPDRPGIDGRAVAAIGRAGVRAERRHAVPPRPPLRRRRPLGTRRSACAASRRAHSWNVGQTGKALERQYASWCGKGARGRLGLGVAAMAVVRSVRPFVPLVFERDERAGRGTVHAGQPSLGHRGR